MNRLFQRLHGDIGPQRAPEPETVRDALWEVVDTDRDSVDVDDVDSFSERRTGELVNLDWRVVQLGLLGPSRKGDLDLMRDLGRHTVVGQRGGDRVFAD